VPCQRLATAATDMCTYPVACSLHLPHVLRRVNHLKQTSVFIIQSMSTRSSQFALVSCNRFQVCSPDLPLRKKLQGCNPISHEGLGRSVHSQQRCCGKGKEQGPAHIANGLLGQILRSECATYNSDQRGDCMAENRACGHTCAQSTQWTLARFDSQVPAHSTVQVKCKLI